MERQETISSKQMAYLFFGFMTGSSIINVPNPLIGLAQNGAWISLMISQIIGFFLLGCVLYLHHKHPGMTFVNYSKKTVGRFVSILFIITFSFVLFIMVSWIVLDMGAFMISTMMRNTPLYAFNALIMASAAMTVRAGIEVMVRMFVIFVHLLLFFVFLVLLLSIPNYHPEFLLPIFPEGLLPVLHGSYFVFGFPFAEVIVFTMLLSFTSKKAGDGLNKKMFLSLFFNGLILMITTIVTIMVFGPIAGEIKYSLFGVSRLIDIANFLQRIESVIGISLIAGSYMKATIALYALNLMLSQLFKLKDDRILIFPISISCFLLTLVMFNNESEFIEKVTQVWPLTHFSFTVTPVLIVALVTLIRSKLNKQ